MPPNAGGVIAAASIPAVFATIAVGLRLYARRIKRQTFGVDDQAVVPCVVGKLNRVTTVNAYHIVRFKDSNLDSWCHSYLGYRDSCFTK